MPYEYIDPETLLTHEGIEVYRVYSDSGNVAGFWYTVDATDADLDNPTGNAQFDVRDIPVPRHLDQENHKGIIEWAIWKGWLTEEGLKELVTRHFIRGPWGYFNKEKVFWTTLVNEATGFEDRAAARQAIKETFPNRHHWPKGGYTIEEVILPADI